MSTAREKAREVSKGEKKNASELVKLDVHDIAALDKMDDVPKTDDTAKHGKGAILSTVKALYRDKQFMHNTAGLPKGLAFGVLLDKTNLYAESGGQECDTGKLMIDGVAEMAISNVYSYGGYVLHGGYPKDGVLSIGNKVLVEYDESRRQPIRANHTGTHLLNYSAREVLGKEVEQKGSLFSLEKLRFDLSHKVAITDEELQRIETLSAIMIQNGMEVFTSDVNLLTARQIEGVRSISGEMYPDPVRVVSIGVPIDELLVDVASKDGWKYSVEFCGGTHVARTNELRELIMVEEFGIAKGIRRIVAVTGQATVAVRQHARNFEERLDRLERMSTSTDREILMKDMQAELARLTISALAKRAFTRRCEKVAVDMLKEQKEMQKTNLAAAMHLINSHFEHNKASTSFVARISTTSFSAKMVSECVKYIFSKHKDKSVYVFGVDSVTSTIAHGCSVSQEHESKGLVASEWAARVTEMVGGKAGGKGATCVGSGIDAGKVDLGVEAAMDHLKKLGIS